MAINTRSASRRRVLAASGSLATLGLAGCLGGDDDGNDTGNEDENGEGENGDDDEGEPDDLEVEEFDIIDRDDDSVAIYIHGDHWHDDPLEVPHDDNLSLGAHVEDEEGDEIELGDEYELAVEVSDSAEEGIVESDPDEDFHGDHVHLYGVDDGFTTVVFQVRSDDHVVYETPDLEVVVGDDHEDDDHDDDHDHDDDDHDHDDDDHDHDDDDHDHDDDDHDHDDDDH